MIRTLSPLLTVAATTALASCAPVPEAQSTQSDAPDESIAGLDTSKQCFFVRTVDRYSQEPDAPNGNARISVRAGGKERFVLESVGSCPDIDFSYKVALDNRFGSTLCTGDDATLLVPSPTGTDSCMVRVIGRIEK